MKRPQKQCCIPTSSFAAIAGTVKVNLRPNWYDMGGNGQSNRLEQYEYG